MRLLVLPLLLASTTALAQPALDRTSVVFHLVPHNDKAEWTWTPSIRFKLQGPLASSANLSVEYTLPNGKPFVKVTCDGISEIGAGDKLTISDCGYRQDDKVATNQTGLFGVQIKLNDPLQGSSQTLFAGKFTVGKQVYNPTKDPSRGRQFYYYVDQDWRLPIGYARVFKDDTANLLLTEIWIKGAIADTGKIKGYLFLNGKQVAEASPGYPVRATPPDTPAWEYHQVQFKFPALTEKPYADSDYYRLYENPGTYEVKVLRDGKIARTFKVTIESGKPRDSGAAKTAGLEGALFPVTVNGGDGTWRAGAWKTEAFFANPIPGL